MRIFENFRYRSEIDGLRAISVLAVVLYHAGLGFPGGFVGVDVFFVISGFLITSLIWKDLERGSFTFTNFWERRARRILPALVVVTVVTLVAGWFVMMPDDFKSLGKASASQSVFGANFHYWKSIDYFTASGDEKPLLHTWSLAVEEQFYVFVPFILWGMALSSALKRRSAILVLFFAGFIISLGLSIWGVLNHPPAAFYILPSRAWELLLGSIVAFLPNLPSFFLKGKRRDWLASIGLLLILVPIFTYTSLTPFPGLAALPPCLGAALIIWSNKRDNDEIPTLVGVILSIKPMIFIGAISYSWYLWHWPLFAFSNYHATAPASFKEQVLLLVIGLICGVVSWRYVETPFRKRQLGSSRKTMFGYAGAGLATVFGFGLLCVVTNGFQNRIPEQALAFNDAKLDQAYINQLDDNDIRTGNAAPMGVVGKNTSPTMMLWGDSHSMAAAPAIDEILLESGHSGLVATHSSTAPVINWFKQTRFGLNEKSPAFNESVVSYVEKHNIPLVVLHAHWRTYVTSPEAEDGAFEESLLATVERLVEIGAKPYILLDVPRHTFDVPRKMARSVISGGEVSMLCTKRVPEGDYDAFSPNVIKAIKDAGGVIVDLKPIFLDAEGEYYRVHSDEIVFYRDNSHLTVAGAKFMLKPFLADVFAGDL